jgi:type IV pilus assembly protein PilV
MILSKNHRGDLRQRGMSMLEVLITLVVFSLGVLSVAMLQGVSSRANYEAVQRTTAAYVANDLLERMRANPTALELYMPAGPLGNGSLGAEPAPDCASLANVCTPDQLALHDLWQWEQILDGVAEADGASATGGLLEPNACITGPAGGGQGTYTVSIAWRGQSALTNPAVDDCGDDSGLYGDKNEFRRIVVAQTYISGV